MECFLFHFWRQDFSKVFLADAHTSGGGQSATAVAQAEEHSDGKKEGEHNQPEKKEFIDPEEDLSKFSKDKLREDFHRQLTVNGEQIWQAQKTLDEIKKRPDIPEEEKRALEQLLQQYRQFITGREPIMEDIRNIGKSVFADTSTIVSRARLLHKEVMARTEGISQEYARDTKRVLQRHANELLICAQQSPNLKQVLDEVGEFNGQCHKLDPEERLRRWENIRTRFGQLDKSTRGFLPEYAELYTVAYQVMQAQQGHSDVHLPTVVAQFLQYTKDLEEVKFIKEKMKNQKGEAEGLKTIQDLEWKIAQDLGMDVKEVKLKPGARFKFSQAGPYEVREVTGTEIIMHGGRRRNGVRCTPAQLYTALYKAPMQYGQSPREDESHGHGDEHGEPHDIGKDIKLYDCTFTPALKSKEDLERAMQLTETEQTLRPGEAGEGTKLQTEKSQDYYVYKIDEHKKTIELAHSKKFNEEEGHYEWKVKRMSFEEFYKELWKDKNMGYVGIKKEAGSEHSLKNNKISYDPLLEEKKQRPHLMSLSGLVQSVKWINDSVKRMSTERSEVDASNFSKKIAGYMDNIPWLKGIESIAITGNNELILGKVQKWADQYTKGIKTSEFDLEWKRFHTHNKIRQAALCIAAGNRGASEEEIWWKLGGDAQVWPSHEMCVKFFQEYFCSGPDGLPKKVESYISTANGEGYEKEVKKGVDDTKANADYEEDIEMIRLWKGKNKWKRCRALGGLYAMMKLGCPANALGVATFWFFKGVESLDGKDRNDFCEEMMRKVGNTGKTWFPMLGLFRFPDGMATARAMIDYYTQITGGNVWEAKSNHEEIMGDLFSGRWPVAVKNMKKYGIWDKMGAQAQERLRYLYMRCRMYGLAMSEGSIFRTKYEHGCELDESTLGSSFGLSGIMSKQWLTTVLEARAPSGEPKFQHSNIENLQSWWSTISKDLDGEEVITKAEKLLFASNFAHVFYEGEVDDKGQEEYFKAPIRRDTIFKVFKLLKKPSAHYKFQWTDNRMPKDVQYYEADSIEEIEDIMRKRQKTDKFYQVMKIKIDHEVVDATLHEAERIDPFLKIGRSKAVKNTDLDLKIKQRIRDIQNENYVTEEAAAIHMTQREVAALVREKAKD